MVLVRGKAASGRSDSARRARHRAGLSLVRRRAAAVAAARMAMVVPAEEIGLNVAAVRHRIGIGGVCGREDDDSSGGELNPGRCSGSCRAASNLGVCRREDSNCPSKRIGAGVALATAARKNQQSNLLEGVPVDDVENNFLGAPCSVDLAWPGLRQVGR